MYTRIHFIPAYCFKLIFIVYFGYTKIGKDIKMNEKILNITEMVIHPLAELTPSMTTEQYEALKESLQSMGQLQPVIMYRGKVIDGRHRVKALRELDMETVKAVSENSQMSEEDIKERIIKGYENRRHQTTTQKAIMAYKEYLRLKTTGEKCNQGAIAASMGTTRLQLSRAKTLHELAGDNVIKLLFNGNKINIGSTAIPSNTDNLYSLINYFKKHTEEIIASSEESTIAEDFTDDELAQLNKILIDLQNELSHRMLERLNRMVHFLIKRND